MLALIVLCEIGFWMLLLSGLLARYVFKQKRISNLLLICVPLADIVHRRSCPHGTLDEVAEDTHRIRVRMVCIRAGLQRYIQKPRAWA